MRKKRAEKEIIQAAREYRAFKRLTIRKGKENVWRDSGKIHFYCVVMEYFQYCEDRNGWEVLEGLTLPIWAMWNCYLKYECLEYTTWRGIERILEWMRYDRGVTGPEP